MAGFSEEEVTAGARALFRHETVRSALYLAAPGPSLEAAVCAVLEASGAVPGAEHERVERQRDEWVKDFATLERDRDALRAELERVKAALYDETVGALAMLRRCDEERMELKQQIRAE